MENPFERRATELVRNDEAFLGLVSPEPLNVYFKSYGSSGTLYDRLTVVVGTPGSGKTTLARLYEYSILSALLRHPNAPDHRALLNAMVDLGAINKHRRPAVLACRLPLESDYREIWEFPYSTDIRQSLLRSLIQARAVAGWFKQLKRSGSDINKLQAVSSHDSLLDSIGGPHADGMLAKATAIDRQIYGLVGALVLPSSESLPEILNDNYRPFDLIDTFELQTSDTETISLIPLVILDDAHTLSADQLTGVMRWLARREPRIARWILTRFDVLPADEAIAALLNPDAEHIELPGITTAREITVVPLQKPGARREHRTNFRKMAKDMANRYLAQMQQFSSRRLEDLSNMLSEESDQLPSSMLKDLEKKVASVQAQLHISPERRTELEKEVDKYAAGFPDVGTDERLAMLSILLHRYAKRVPQAALFSDLADPEPSRPLSVDNSVYEAARLHLLHHYHRAFFYGVNDLADASSENAEQFLRLAGILVDAISTRLIRSRSPLLTATEQHDLLTRRAEEFVNGWSFPQVDRVKKLIQFISDKCVQVSLQPNAWIGAGANAYGIPQDQFADISKSHLNLAKTLHYAVAYNALNLVPKYECKNRLWCLLELGGLVILKEGLTLKRGGFIEGDINELASLNRSLAG